MKLQQSLLAGSGGLAAAALLVASGAIGPPTAAADSASSTDATSTIATTTATSTGAVISDIAASSTAGGAGALITWMTDVPADSQVEYGTTTGYGLVSGLFDTTTPATDHAVELGGLAPDTEYHYRALSTTASTSSSSPVTTLSLDQTFTTALASTSGTSTATTSTSTPSAGSLNDLVVQLQSLQIDFPAYSGMIQSLIDDLMGTGTTSTSTPPVSNPSGATIDQNGQTFQAGGTIDFGGRNFGHEQNVTVALNGRTLATPHADGGGNFSTGSLSLPSTPGTYTYTFSDQSGTTVSATITLQ